MKFASVGNFASGEIIKSDSLEFVRKFQFLLLDIGTYRENVNLLLVPTGQTLSLLQAQIIPLSFRLNESLIYYTFFCLVSDFSRFFYMKLEKLKKILSKNICLLYVKNLLTSEFSFFQSRYLRINLKLQGHKKHVTYHQN